MNNIKMIALDLDGTTLDKDGKFSSKTKEVLERATGEGIHVIIATGRTFNSLPSELFEIEGLEYVVTSNGAHITKLNDGKRIYENIIGAEAVEEVVSAIKETNYHLEAFIDGKAYITRSVFEDLRDNGSTYRDVPYIMATRNPVENVLKYTLEHKNSIENISINFPFQSDREFLMKHLAHIKNITLTSSFCTNIEVGGATTSKGTALSYLLDLLNVDAKELMACGDSPNDLAMIKLAGIGVAMGNASDIVKENSDYITDHHHEDGVAKAIEIKVFDI